MIETIQERLNLFIDAKNLSVKQFELKCGLSDGIASDASGNVNKSTLGEISNAFPDLNIVWLLTGEGEMLLENVPAMISDDLQIMDNQNTDSNDLCNYPKDTIAALKTHINILNERIREKDAQIQKLLELLENNNLMTNWIKTGLHWLFSDKRDDGYFQQEKEESREYYDQSWHHPFCSPKEDLNFTAVDVETATSAANICQIGIVVIEHGEITEKVSYMVKPRDNQYNVFTSMVHGISPKDTENCPLFPEVWEKIKKFFEDRVIVGHNVSYDNAAISNDLKSYGLPPLEIAARVCTCNLHGGVRLDDACRHYGIELKNHHDALADAEASARVYLKYLEAGIERPYVNRTEQVESRHIEHDTLKQDLENCVRTDTIFYDKKIVITGVLERFPVRETLASLLKSFGGDINTSISKKTDIVIVGHGAGPKKMEKIEQLNSSGEGNIRIVREDELYNILDCLS